MFCWGEKDSADAAEGNLCVGREDGVHWGVAERRAAMRVLCARYGISRDTGYRLVARYEREDAEGLRPRSRAPH